MSSPWAYQLSNTDIRVGLHSAGLALVSTLLGIQLQTDLDSHNFKVVPVPSGSLPCHPLGLGDLMDRVKTGE